LKGFAVLAKKTIKNQITLPKAVVSHTILFRKE